MSDWTSHLTTQSPPWSTDSDNSSDASISSNWTLSMVTRSDEEGNVLQQSVELSSSISGPGVPEGMLLGIGISFSFVLVVGCSVYLTRR